MDTVPSEGSQSDPQGPDSGSEKVVRGGAFDSGSDFWGDTTNVESARPGNAANQGRQPPNSPSRTVGFRVVLAPNS